MHEPNGNDRPQTMHNIAHPSNFPAVQPISNFTAQQIATLQSRLDRRLGPEYISSRPGAGGVKVYYVAAEKVIGLANEVFGFNGWSSSVQNTQVDFVDESQGGKVSIGLSTVVRVTLKDGTFHEDIGYGQIENCRSKAAAFEKVKKGATTDALKRALRNFGNVLGNCLYDKDYLSKINKVKVEKARWEPDQLHRHPDYCTKNTRNAAPSAIKTEPVDERTADAHSVNGDDANLIEYEDDFGGNFFDEMDFADDQADEVLGEGEGIDNDETRGRRPQVRPETTRNEGSFPRTAQNRRIPSNGNGIGNGNGNGNDNGNLGIKSEQCKRNLADSVLPPDHAVSKTLTTVPNNSTGVLPNSRFPANGRHLPPIHHSSTTSHPNNNDSGPQRPEGERFATTDKSLPQGDERPTGFQRSVQAQGPQIPQMKDAAPGFVASRAAPLLQAAEGENPSVPPQVTLPPFDPRADSPSLRRTSGFDHSKTIPVSRQSVMLAAGPPTNSTSTSAPAAGTAATAAAFSNPPGAGDQPRKIGMPPPVHTPLANRSTYKTPTMYAMKRAAGDVPRSPLADVSNLRKEPATPDPKKARMD